MSYEHKTSGLAQLLLPSWLSGLVCVVSPLAFISVTATNTLIHRPATSTALATSRQTEMTISNGYQIFLGWVSRSAYVRNLPLIFFWAVVGFAAYLFLVTCIKSLANIVDFGNEMHYVHAHPALLIRDALLHLTIRLFCASCLGIVLFYSVHNLIPFAFATARAAGLQLTTTTAFQAFQGIIYLTLSLHAQTILLRLLFLRARLFGDPILP